MRELIVLISFGKQLNLCFVSLKTVFIYTKRRNLSSIIKEKLRKLYNKNNLASAFIIYEFKDTEKTRLTLKFIENYKKNTILFCKLMLRI